MVAQAVGGAGLSLAEFWSMSWWEYCAVVRGYKEREQLYWENRYLVSWYDGMHSQSDLRKHSFHKWKSAITMTDAQAEHMRRMKALHEAHVKQIEKWNKSHGIQ